jgi:hypothetical protein
VLAGLGPFDLGDETGQLPGERTVRIMLHDLADLDDLDRRDHGTGHPPSDDDLELRWERRRSLLDDFRQLRDLIG